MGESTEQRQEGVGPLMSEMIVGGAFQAIQGSRKKLDTDSSRLLHRVEERLLMFLALQVGLIRRAQVLAGPGDREGLFPVDVVSTGFQPQREATLAQAAVEAEDDAPPCSRPLPSRRSAAGSFRS